MTSLEEKARKREYNARYRAENPEIVRRAKANWRAKNPEAVKRYDRSYYEKHPDYASKRAKRQWETNPEKVKERLWRASIKAKYGLTPEGYQQLLLAQGSVCAICKKPCSRGKLSVDHDHKTGKIRGLLCRACNHGLGSFVDDAARLREAAAYLEKQ